MADWKNPDITIKFNYDDITDESVDFVIEDAGIKRCPSLTLTLKSSTLDVNVGGTIEILADVRGELDRIFHGITTSFRLRQQRGTMYIVAEALQTNALKLINDTITHDFADNGWICKEAIEAMLELPDSGHETGIGLDTDSGEIQKATFPVNCKKMSLLQAIRKAADYLGYDGYIQYRTSNPKLSLKCYQSGNETLEEVNPSFTISEGTLLIYERNIDDLYNAVIVDGQSDAGFPVQDHWTEKGITKWPDAWSPYSDTGANIHLSDIAAAASQGGRYSVEILQNDSGNEPQEMGFIFDITKTDYERPQDGLNRVKLDERFKSLRFSYYSNQYSYAKADLIDVNGKKAYLYYSVMLGPYQWHDVILQLEDKSQWTTDPDFNWNEIAKIKVYGASAAGGSVPSKWAYGDYIYIDLLRFEGQGWAIDYFSYPDYNPLYEDESSQSLYGLRIKHLTKYREKIRCFEHARKVGKSFLNIHKAPFDYITITTTDAKTWIRAGQYCKLNIPHLGIYNQNWRIVKVTFNWKSEGNRLKSTLDLVPLNQSFDSEDWLGRSLGGILSWFQQK